MGRRKIVIEKVKDNGSRQVTFSKRRTGIFKKANELATLCAVQIAIVIFSPGGKAFSFGHPNVETVAKRFLNDDSKAKVFTPKHVNSQCMTRVEHLSHQLNDLLKKLEAEKKRGLMLDKAVKASGRKVFGKPLNELNQQELLEKKKALEKLQERMKVRINEIEASQSLLLLSKNTPNDDV